MTLRQVRSRQRLAFERLLLKRLDGLRPVKDIRALVAGFPDTPQQFKDSLETTLERLASKGLLDRWLFCDDKLVPWEVLPDPLRARELGIIGRDNSVMKRVWRQTGRGNKRHYIRLQKEQGNHDFDNSKLELGYCRSETGQAERYCNAVGNRDARVRAKREGPKTTAAAPVLAATQPVTAAPQETNGQAAPAAGQAVALAAPAPAHQTAPHRARPRLDMVELNKKAKLYLHRQRSLSIRKLAKKLHCSTATAFKLPAWKAHMGRNPKKYIRTANDAELARLTVEQKNDAGADSLPDYETPQSL